MSDDQPVVSIIMPCYNERAFIGKALESLLRQDYPADRTEILVVDGGSNDGTRHIIERMASDDQRVRMIDNPHRSKSRALNLGISHARGDVVMRVDAHATYAPDYVSLSVRHLVRTGADNVGGLRGTSPQKDTKLGHAIALSISSRFGSGGATYRAGASGQRWVDTVFGGCYRREVFDRVGKFDERLYRGQDREFNARLVSAGGRILFDPDIRCTYYARSDLKSFVPWIFVSGMTPFYISRITRTRTWSWRNFAPPIFVLALPALAALGLLFTAAWLVLAALSAVYLVVTMSFAAVEASRAGDWLLFPWLAVIFVLTHFAYGLGSLWGFVRPVRQSRGWASA